MATRCRWSLLVMLSVLASQMAVAQAPATQGAVPAQSPAPSPTEKRVAIVVGISDYPPESGFPKLRYAAKDAEDLASDLGKQGYQTELLTDQHAMKSSIRRALQQAHDILSQSGAGQGESGTILFFFSGHGGQASGTGSVPRQYLVTYDSTSDDSEPGYPLKDIADALENSGAAHRMMFIDACRDQTGTSSKGAPVLTSFRQLIAARGIKIFFSTAPGQQSYEDAAAQNGYFTHYLLEGLDGKAAASDGLITFDGLAKWVSDAMRSDTSVYQTPYWNQNASGDFYLAGGTVRKVALVVGTDNYEGAVLHSAIAGARQVNAQLNQVGFTTTYIENATGDQLRAALNTFAVGLGPRDVALVYFAGSGGIATGMPFLMGVDAKLPAEIPGGRWDKGPAASVTMGEVMDTVRRNHAGPNIYLLDMGMARASSADVLNLTLLKREHSLALFCCKSGQEPERTAEGSLFARVFTSVLHQPNMSAGYAASQIVSAVFDQTNGVEYAIEIPMLPDRVYLTPSQ
jgi:uncharacterized caspase-like protein